MSDNTPTEQSPQPSSPAQAEPAPTPLQTNRARLEAVHGYYNDRTLIETEDYGVIPGASNKPTLLKPGAQKLCALFDLAPEIKDNKRVLRDDLIAYEIVVLVRNKTTGVAEGEGIGMCNSRERRYKSQDPYNIANTLLKMAEKRALVDATLNALGISSLFTQDIEDLETHDAPHPAPRSRPTPQPAHQNGQRPPRNGQRPQAQRPAQSQPSPPAPDEACTEYVELRALAIWLSINPAPPELPEVISGPRLATWTASCRKGIETACQKLGMTPQEAEEAWRADVAESVEQSHEQPQEVPA